MTSNPVNWTYKQVGVCTRVLPSEERAFQSTRYRRVEKTNIGAFLTSALFSSFSSLTIEMFFFDAVVAATANFFVRAGTVARAGSGWNEKMRLELSVLVRVPVSLVLTLGVALVGVFREGFSVDDRPPLPSFRPRFDSGLFADGGRISSKETLDSVNSVFEDLSTRFSSTAFVLNEDRNESMFLSVHERDIPPPVVRS